MIMELFFGLSNLILVIFCIAGIIFGLIVLINDDDYEKRILALVGFLLSVLILFSMYGNTFYFESFKTHYKIEPIIKVVEYENNYNEKYKDTVYYYKPKFR